LIQVTGTAASALVTRGRKRLLWISAKTLVLLAVAIVLFMGFAPLLRSTENFRAFTGDDRVRYEPGAEKAAAIIASALPDAIATIERGQFRAFAKPVRIYVCATETSFERYGYGIRGAGGFVFNGRLFISPKPQNTGERLPRLLTHELSHLHLNQQMGTLRYARKLPSWFTEGLAVHVSGSGAETVGETEARDAIRHGRVFRPLPKGSLLFWQTGGREGLSPHLFYRQSAMFVGFLARRDPAAFELGLKNLQDRQDFAAAIRHAYGRDLEALWLEFIASVKG
jgi:hypothetical protein